MALVWKYNILLIAIVGKNSARFTYEVRLINALSEHVESIIHVQDFDQIASISLSPDGEFITLLFCRTIYEDFNPEYDTYVKVEVIATSTGEAAGTYRLGDPFDDRPDPPPIAWSPDSTRIAVCSAEELHIWEVSTQKVLLFEAYSSIIAWSPDGKRIAADDQNEVKLFDARTGHEILTNMGQPQIMINHYITAIAWSPDGRRIISASRQEEDLSSNAIVQIWDTSTGEHIITRQTSSGLVESLDWSPDGKHIAVAFREGEIQVWTAS